jgi:galactose-1-phosphate uridylyltransferase
VKVKVDFEVIEIMDDYYPYPSLLGIDWAFDNNVVLNLKKQQMSFETNTMRVITPLDPNEWDKYNESVDEDAQMSIIENIYKIMGHKEYYVNPMVDGKLSWRSVKSYDINLEDTMERWKHKMYEVSSR